MTKIDELLEKGRVFDAFVLARYCYRMGLPTIEDSVYDSLERELRESGLKDCEEYLNRSYDDDPIPEALLQECGIAVESSGITEEMYQYLQGEKSNSIKAITSYEEAYEFVQNNKGKELVFSLKLDGVNKKVLYVDGEYKMSLSRGRGGNCLDYTLGSKYVVPKSINASGTVKITAECFVDKKALSRIREKYNPESYKTSKSAAISMLRVQHDVEDYNYLRMLAFSMEGAHFEKVSDMFAALEGEGFETPPYIIATPDDLSYDDFCAWLKGSILDRLAVFRSVYPSDGVVMEVNSLTDVYSDEHQYNERQKAIKFEQWKFEAMQGVITDILIKQQRVYKSVRIKIEPVYSSDGCKAEYINGFNPGIIIQNGLYVGKRVWFERNAGAVNILIHGERMKSLEECEEYENGA